MFWSNDNHRGTFLGVTLAEEVSDESGRVSVPDGDFRYWFKIDRPLYQLAAWATRLPEGGRAAAGPISLVTYLAGEETVVELNRLRRQPLEMLVQRKGQPVANRDLCAESFDVSCNFYDHCEPITTTDANGHILVEEFYPEQWQHIFFLGDAGLLRAADVEDLAIGGLISVDLP
jgi:hypothetical protein